MTTEVKTICDECGRVKGETNRWWKTWRTASGIIIAHAHAAGMVAVSKDLCGEKCVIACVQKFLAEEPSSERKV